jgi:uncharacterized protein
MLKRRFYYTLKPYLPWRLRFAIRKISARRIRARANGSWPICESAAQTPTNWPGWPGGKQFAFVLTHDVEHGAGVAKSRRLAELEQQLGFRSSFNFVPEGKYTTPPELRHWLTENGFEVGVHDLHHDGRLYDSSAAFAKKAKKINGYLKEWNAVGFRSGFMLNRLDWLHELEVQYDASTFDTDPFEPQPEGRNTIFPFVANGTNGQPRFVELPYTLVQDSTLFLLLGETTPDIWLKKADWIAHHGGMALVIIHPDYVRFPGEPASAGTYDVQLYIDFLQTMKVRYADKYWHALPREVASFTRHHSIPNTTVPPTLSATSSKPKPKIWIDLENTPHIPFFKPIIRELNARGYSVVLTARDAYQTCEMADKFGLKYTKIGRHYGKNRFLKGWGLFARGAQLFPFARREKPVLALNHGSRTQSLVCNALGIPTVTIMDYEYTAELFFLRPRWEIVPSVVNSADMPHQKNGGVRTYSGIKEDVYVPDFTPDPSIFNVLGLNPNDIVITVRPPASEAHYHVSESDQLFRAAMDRFCRTAGVRIVLLPRNKRQEAEIRANHPQWFQNDITIVPKQVVDGLNLLWHSDLVVSGGGTMNREAAALGLPVYSIFRGRIGAVDQHLAADGRLVLIESVEDVDRKITISRRAKAAQANLGPRKALSDIVGHIEQILAAGRS